MITVGKYGGCDIVMETKTQFITTSEFDIYLFEKDESKIGITTPLILKGIHL
jgi:hypothetical protein